MSNAPVAKKKIFDLVNEQAFDNLRARKLPDGNVALYDPDTGIDKVILHKWRPKHEMIELLFDEVETPLGKVFFDKDSYLQHKNSKGIYYSSQWADLFCSEVYESPTHIGLSEICKKENMPRFETLRLWMDRYPEFGKRVEAALAARGERARDEAMMVSHEMYQTEDPEKYMVAKAHIENLKWSAAKDNPKRFSNHVEIHNTQAPVVVRLETGVRVNAELPESVRNVKELTGENAQEIIKKLEESDGNS